jgi:hypothetical protein
MIPVALPYANYQPSAIYQENIYDLSEENSGDMFLVALEKANTILASNGHQFQIIFIGQPVKEPVQDSQTLKINAQEPLDLAILWPDQTQEPIDMVNVIDMGNNLGKGRQTDHLKLTKTLATEIVSKVEKHLAAKENPHILISSSGSKYDVTELTGHTLSIDPQGYLRLDNLRIIRKMPDGNYLVTKAASLRSNEVMKLKISDKGLVYIDDEYDPAPPFFINPNQTITVQLEQIIEKYQEDARNYSSPYYLLQRGYL